MKNEVLRGPAGPAIDITWWFVFSMLFCGSKRDVDKVYEQSVHFTFGWVNKNKTKLIHYILHYTKWDYYISAL